MFWKLFDGAHWSPWPCVPTASEASGRGPVPAHGRVECITVPLTATGPPAAPVDR